MKAKHFILWFTLTLLTTIPLTAQDWSDYRQLFGLLEKQEQDLFRAELKALMENLNRGSNAQMSIFNAFRNELPGMSHPTAGIEDMLEELANGRENLAALLDSSNMLSGEASVLLGIFDAGNAAWVSQLEAIQADFENARGVFNGVDQNALYRARRAFQSAESERRSAMSTAMRQFNQYFSGEQSGVGDADLNYLLTVGPLEAGVGTQKGTATYYNYQPDAGTFALIRFGSAPNYETLWGTEWDSWISVAKMAGASLQEGGEGQRPQSTEPASYPLMAGGNISFQFRPSLGFFGASRVRLIAGVGAKAEAYLPKRIDPNIPATFDNQGKTTGIGPNARLGFSVNTGGVNFYAVSNTARGYVIRCPDYPFISDQLTSGAYWKGYHLRISTGHTRWAPSKRRTAQYVEASFNMTLKGG